MKRLLSTVAVTLTLFSAAHADVEIRMRPGSQCWSYQGLDSRYSGSFSSGQAVTVAVVEENSTGNGGREAITYDASKIWVNGPGLYKDGNREGPNDRVIITEKPSRYVFNLYEHGTGAAGSVFVKICAAKKK
jgi:hypothetical protein